MSDPKSFLETPLTALVLKPREGRLISLGPWKKPLEALTVLDRPGPLEARYGQDLDPGDLALLKLRWTQDLEASLKAWAGEVRFLPKFLISALVFLGVYWFLTLAVRDPLPLIDELVFGLAAAGATFWLWDRRGSWPERFKARAEAARQRLDTLVFYADPRAASWEAAWARSEALSEDELWAELWDRPGKSGPAAGAGATAESDRWLALVENPYLNAARRWLIFRRREPLQGWDRRARGLAFCRQEGLEPADLHWALFGLS